MPPLPWLHVVGDSISIQYGPYLESFLSGTVRYSRKTGEEEGVRKNPAIHSANGGDTGAVLAYLQARFQDAAFRPDLLLINAGLHDIRTDPDSRRIQVPIDTYRDHLQAILARCAESSVTPAWVRSTPCFAAIHNKAGMAFHRHEDDLAAYNQAADKIMAEAGVPAIDLYNLTLVNAPPGELFVDHTHFTERVREIQGAYIAGWVARYFGSR